MTRRIDRLVILCLVLVNITLIALVAVQGQKIDAALDEVQRQGEEIAQEMGRREEERMAAEPEIISESEEEPEQKAPAESFFSGETFTAYAYCPCEKCCGVWAQYGTTKSGTNPQQGRTVAVDPDVIPLGTQLWIDGKGPYVAEDTGSGIKGRTLDMFFDSHEDALSWGRQTVTVEISR